MNVILSKFFTILILRLYSVLTIVTTAKITQDFVCLV